MKSLASELVGKMAELSYIKNAEVALDHAELNNPHIKHTVLELAPSNGNHNVPDSAIVIGAGPSLRNENSIRQILDSGYKGATICADGALSQCLWNGLIPDYVVTVDPQDRIVRWFGDTKLTATAKGDVFVRQDTDAFLGPDELARNQERIELVNTHAPSIKGVMATSVHPRVTERCQEAGLELFWWNPLYDDFSDTDSLTRKLFALTRAPCMVSGGNSGSSAWVFAHTVLQIKNVALVGIDFGYEPGTDIQKTRYYGDAFELFGDRVEDIFIDIHNPYLDETWFTDPAFYWYRQSFLEMATVAECTTSNCTGGGILFGDGVVFSPLAEFLELHA